MILIKDEIEALKYELNCLIGRNADFASVYELSVKLDGLIMQYYNQKYNRKAGGK